MENILFLAFVLLFVLLMSAHIYTTNAFFVRLKESHEEVWKDLGQPKWKIHFGDDSFQNAMKYIREKKFSELNDALLANYYKKLKSVEYFSAFAAFLIVVFTIIDILQG